VAVAEETAAEMPADEACTAGDENVHSDQCVLQALRMRTRLTNQAKIVRQLTNHKSAIDDLLKMPYFLHSA
jgi:hypothetical protein